MSTRIAMRWLVSVTATLVVPSLTAQTLGLPSQYRGVMSGFGAAVDAGGDKAGFRTIGFTGTVALGHVTADSMRMALFDVSGSVARLAGTATEASGSAIGAEVSVLGSFKIGVDRSRWGGVTRLYIPLAAAIPVAMCTNRNGMFTLYGVPVWNFERVERPTGTSWQSSWGSVGIGSFFELRSGLGFQLGVGGLFHHPGPDPYQRVVVGVGFHYSLHGLYRQAASPDRRECTFGL